MGTIIGKSSNTTAQGVGAGQQSCIREDAPAVGQPQPELARLPQYFLSFTSMMIIF